MNENVGVWVRGWVKCGCGVDEGQGVSEGVRKGVNVGHGVAVRQLWVLVRDMVRVREFVKA